MQHTHECSRNINPETSDIKQTLTGTFYCTVSTFTLILELNVAYNTLNAGH